jgi:hypothetical protein
LTGRHGKGFDNRRDVIKDSSQTWLTGGSSIASILGKEDVDSEGSQIGGKLRQAVSHHFSISMEMHKGQGGRVRRDVGAGKKCLVAIDPEDIRRRLAPRGKVASAQCRMVKNRSRHVSRLIRDTYTFYVFFSVLAVRYSTMTRASPIGSVVNGAASRRDTVVLNRSAAWRMGRGREAAC